jgi:hypothetical protein
MSLAPSNVIPRALVNTVLAPLVPLLLPGALGNQQEAHDAALELLMEYRPQSREELRLPGEVVGFGLQVLDPVREAARPGTPSNVALRLRASASGMRRSEQATKRELDVLQHTHREAAAAARNAPPPMTSEQTAALEAAIAEVQARLAESRARLGEFCDVLEADDVIGRSVWDETVQAAAAAAQSEAAGEGWDDWPYYAGAAHGAVHAAAARPHATADVTPGPIYDASGGAILDAVAGVLTPDALAGAMPAGTNAPSRPDVFHLAFADAFGTAQIEDLRSTCRRPTLAAGSVSPG